MVIILLVLPSCKSVEAVTTDTHNSSIIAHSSHHDTVMLRDTIYRHDSVIYRERTIHDTVFITKEIYRDQRLSTFNSQLSTNVDTVIVTEYQDRVIEQPPERYVPKFYKWCTALVLLFILLAILYLIYRWYRKR